ncbi:hypothetical protein [Campylobacter coli]|uniref:hypothetical protein n=1 Tax=Campylobacter coli TaxID=195 RepID=UPI001293628B|nr:hypothetical protein [Campylobacter coli]
MQVKFFLKNRIFLSFASVALIFNSVSYAASQAISIGDKRFQTPRHSFSNEEVWDFDDKTFKQINGTNYYGVFKQGLVSDITLEVFNPKQSLQGAKLEILTLNHSSEEILEVQSMHAANPMDKNLHPIKILPFLVTGSSLKGDSINNKLLIKEAELSSAVFLEPSNIKTKNPPKKEEKDKINYVISGGLAREGNAKNNTLELLDGSYINMGVENIYNLKLNGAPYAVGGLAIFGDAIGNSLLAQKGSKVDIHTASFYRDMVGEFILDERITHLVGGLAYNGKVEKNKLNLNGVEFNIHAPSGLYSSFAPVHIAGAFVDGNGKKAYDATKNTLVIDNFLLNLRADGKTPIFYNAIFLANFFGGKTNKEDANANSIVLKDVPALKRISKKVKVQGIYDFFSGYTLDGEANFNVIDFKDSQASLPLFIYATTQENFEGSIHYPEYAKHNKISLNNVFGRKDIRSGVEAMNVENNQVFYHNVEAQASGEGVNRESSVYIRAANLSKNNLFKASNYWATSMLNIYGIREVEESKNNQVIFNNVGFNTDRISEGSELILIGGVGKRVHHNLLSIQDLEIGAYDKEKDFIYIAASAIPDANSNLALSYGNTLYIGGDVSIHERSLLNVLSGSVIRIPNYTNNKADDITLSAPSLAQLTKDNHLILEQALRVRVVNNFEHYSLIYHSNNQDKPFIESLETPINLSEES